MKILVVSGYAAWNKVSQEMMPSHHLFGIHELIDHYEENENGLRGILKMNCFNGGYVDFYIWKSGKKNIFSQIRQLLKKSKEYDVIYDQLNRCSIYLGILKKIGLLKSKLVTILHHPPYGIQLRVSNSDAYIFFNEDYRQLAIKANSKKDNRYYVNEWYPDTMWYRKVLKDQRIAKGDVFFIDTGKSKRDRALLYSAAETAKLRVDYAGDSCGYEGWARPYNVDLKDDIGMARRIRKYRAVVIPVLENKKNKIGPLGITSFLDCIAMGIPTIASDNVCFAEDIEKYTLGLVYETGNANSLAKALEKIYQDKEFYIECCNNIQKYSVKTIQDYSERLVSILLSL